MDQQQLMAQIAQIEADRSEVRQRIIVIKEQLTATEDDLISMNIQLDRLNTQLKELRVNACTNEDDARLQEIADFRRKFPELCK